MSYVLLCSKFCIRSPGKPPTTPPNKSAITCEAHATRHRKRRAQTTDAKGPGRQAPRATTKTTESVLPRPYREVFHDSPQPLKAGIIASTSSEFLDMWLTEANNDTARQCVETNVEECLAVMLALALPCHMQTTAHRNNITDGQERAGRAVVPNCGFCETRVRACRPGRCATHRPIREPGGHKGEAIGQQRPVNNGAQRVRHTTWRRPMRRCR